MTYLFIKFVIVIALATVAMFALTALIGWIAGDEDDDTWQPFL